MALNQYDINTAEVILRLNREISGIKNRSKAGLWEAALLIRREAQLKTPVDTGNLKGSYFVTVFEGPHGVVAEITNTAYYAIYVHEDLEAAHEVGEAKFLEHAILENETTVIEIIARRAAV